MFASSSYFFGVAGSLAGLFGALALLLAGVLVFRPTFYGSLFYSTACGLFLIVVGWASASLFPGVMGSVVALSFFVSIWLGSSGWAFSRSAMAGFVDSDLYSEWFALAFLLWVSGSLVALLISRLALLSG